jgi:short subunit dehydrogenase-like uncharacterized protein
MHRPAEFDFLLYGANGYTGRLIANLAAHQGLRPLLAGRTSDAVSEVAKDTGFEWVSFELSETERLRQALNRCRLALHAAGPFRHTLDPMIESCLQTGRHYIDINGDIACFERMKGYGTKALDRGVMLLPGAGFDVIPTDCLAKWLHDEMPDAVSLRIAFGSMGSRLSHGTAMTMLSKLGEGGMARKDGRILRRPFGEKGMRVDFAGEEHFAMSIPWGDVSTAYHTTGIPDIETYTVVKPGVYKAMKWQWLFNPILRTDAVRNLLRKRVDRSPAGPDDAMRASAYSLAWAELRDRAGNRISATLRGPEVYDITAHGALAVVRRILAGEAHPGYQTPAGCYGADLVLEIPGVRRSEPVWTREPAAAR